MIVFGHFAFLFYIFLAHQHAMHAECDIVITCTTSVRLSNAGIVSKNGYIVALSHTLVKASF